MHVHKFTRMHGIACSFPHDALVHCVTSPQVQRSETCLNAYIMRYMAVVFVAGLYICR